MFETRALQLEVVEKSKGTEKAVVVAHIYVDSENQPVENQPVVQAFGIPLSNVRVVVKADFGSPYCSENWSLQELMDAAKKR